MKRYFIVFYNWSNNVNKHGFGHVSITSVGYINCKQTIEHIKDGINESGHLYPVITNIVELNENDFKEFVK